jgi:hypothetical protein
VEESPEQVLARLARHRDSLVRANRLPTSSAPPAAPSPVPQPPAVIPPTSKSPAPIPAGVIEHRSPTEFIPPSPFSSEHGWRPAQSAVLITLLGLFLAVVACALSVFAFALFGAGVALGLVGAMTAAGLAAAMRRVPVALWWTAGALIGCVLGLWS